MKATLFFLALSALIATIYCANEKNLIVAKEPVKKVVYTEGMIGPNDGLLGTLTLIGEPGNNVDFQETTWRLYDAKAHIAHVTVSEVGPCSNATAKITGGGVGSDFLNFRATPHQGGCYNFEVLIYGTATDPSYDKVHSKEKQSDFSGGTGTLNRNFWGSKKLKKWSWGQR